MDIKDISVRNFGHLPCYSNGAGRWLVMKRFVRNLMIGAGIVCQILILFVYSFGEIVAPRYFYLLLWMLCALFVRQILSKGDCYED